LTYTIGRAICLSVVALQLELDGQTRLACLEEPDTELVEGLLARLSPNSVYRRFFSPQVRADQFRASLLTTDLFDRDAIAALEGGAVVGLAQYSRRKGSGEADMAIVIADARQRQGLGTRLVAALADRAAAAGITAFTVSIQGDNFAAMRLLQRVAPGTRVSFSGGVGEAVIPLE
jgi:ribosomal protein S18 acetylase RimI-like enzyme